MSLVIRPDESLSSEIELRAKEAGMEPEEYALSMLRKSLERNAADFETALKETLEENAELYRRLA